jgi:ferrous iron transport protein A
MKVNAGILKEMALGSMRSGNSGKVCGFRGGRSMASRLAELGIFPGTPLRMVINLRNGPVLVEVRGSRYSLGRGLAEQVQVEPL